jgi:hypothetical protein
MISGTVYKLVDKRVPEVVLYVGSTETSLKIRWSRHKKHAKVRTTKINTYLREQGVEHFELVSLEHGLFKDIAALREREEEYRVKLNPTLNSQKCFTGLTEAEYHKQYNKQHYAENKDEIKKHYVENREKILKRKNETLTCDVCDGTTTRSHKARHERSEKHAKAVVAPFVRATLGRAAFLAKLAKRI